MADLSDDERDALKAVTWWLRIVGGGGLIILALVALNEAFGWMWQQP